MNIWRFFKKCLFNRPTAMQSLKFVMRSLYGRVYWYFHPDKPLAWRLYTGCVLYLEPRHFSTTCLWPALESYEPDLQFFLLHALRPGDVFIDIGANIGFYSVLAGGLVGSKGRVVSVEPNPSEFKLLERNLKANGLSPGIQCALSSRCGEAELFIPVNAEACSSLRLNHVMESMENTPIRKLKVQVNTLDNLIQELALTKVDLIKIDTDGSELDILQSATHLLEKLRPVITIEYTIDTWPCFGASPEQLKDLIHRYSYALRVFDTEKQKLMMLPENIWQSKGASLILIPTHSGPAYDYR